MLSLKGGYERKLQSGACVMRVNVMLTVAAAGLVLTACSGEKSVKVAALQKKDKNLSCSEVMLEINEAEFYRSTAERNKNPGVKSLLMPLGYISTYVDAEEAANAADARIDYLNRIYEILHCDEASGQQRMVKPTPYGQPVYSAPMAAAGGGYGAPVSAGRYERVPARRATPPMGYDEGEAYYTQDNSINSQDFSDQMVLY